MKTCPNCKELIGDSVNTCFKCRYNFVLRRVPTQDEKNRIKAQNIQIQELEREKEESDRIRLENALRSKPDITVTTTSNIEGYRIIKYVDVLFGEIVVPNGIFGALTQGTFFTVSALDKARAMAMDALVAQAMEKHANAIVGVDIDVNNLEHSGVMVSANGTAVVVEKISD